ncbi:MAG: LuxR C-terminal-related transcriptional regulator [Gammaproteobacteria bacterium]|nr:LuxR C-terminal-related transcriptional regulator [Gammaproteobacteria bacterium]MCW8910918.1 LuxR C-terminal-related transcriptional regulator [Gammaproteobacteria bacterium]MCW9003860.1 LuxR C-terminal-related transcriptional regulator [Gammaproteobacteria bacterium]MCW9056451.1 LuxR C-terminal-related transcriptional regulator [Gammaproteobacteria bacterium]
MSALHELFKHTADAVFGIDGNRHVRFWNKGCEKLLGFSSQRAIGRSCAELLCGEDLQGNKVCGPQCSIAEFFDVQTPNSNFDLVLKPESSTPVIVNVGSYYTGKSDQKNNNDVCVFHSMRQVNCHQLIRRLSNDSCTAEKDNEKIHKLSKREYEILRLLPSGVVTRDMADQLDISPATVRNHVKNIFAKLEVRSRAEAITYAMHQGII